jgi:hypothetical protein
MVEWWSGGAVEWLIGCEIGMRLNGIRSVGSCNSLGESCCRFYATCSGSIGAKIKPGFSGSGGLTRESFLGLCVADRG